MKRIEVVDYSYEWPLEFERIKSFLNTSLHDEFDIIHVGSTSVEGLAAKPIIDIVVIANEGDQKTVIKRLAEIGYTHRGDLGIPGREAFKGNDKIQKSFQTHHLYCGAIECDAVQNFLHLKSFLQKNQSYVKAYGNLKKENAKKYYDNIDMYIEAKSDLIAEILSKAGMDENTIKNIKSLNQSK